MLRLKSGLGLGLGGLGLGLGDQAEVSETIGRPFHCRSALPGHSPFPRQTSDVSACTRTCCSKTIYRGEEELYLETDTRPEVRAQSQMREGRSRKGGDKK